MIHKLSIFLLSYLFPATGPCDPDPCNLNGNNGEICDASTGTCNCGDPSTGGSGAVCTEAEYCDAGWCKNIGKSLNLKIPNSC